MMYVGDSDDVTPSIAKYYGEKTYLVDYLLLLNSYTNTTGIFLCPSDPFKDCDSAVGLPVTAPNGGGIGYGSNWGPMLSYKKGAELGGLQKGFDFGKPGQVFAPGISMATVVNPSNMIAYGDSDDTPWYSLCMGSIMSRHFDESKPIMKQSKVRHGGKMNFAWTDGHSKMKRMIGGTWSGTTEWPAYNSRIQEPTLMFANPSDYGDYCSDPTAKIQADIGAVECGLIAKIIADKTLIWPN